jgi:hypothetical protein
MAITKTKGGIGEALILADILRRGYRVALPVGEDCRFDLIVEREWRFRKGSMQIYRIEKWSDLCNMQKL